MYFIQRIVLSMCCSCKSEYGQHNRRNKSHHRPEDERPWFGVTLAEDKIRTDCCFHTAAPVNSRGDVFVIVA